MLVPFVLLPVGDAVPVPAADPGVPLPAALFTAKRGDLEFDMAAAKLLLQVVCCVPRKLKAVAELVEFGESMTDEELPVEEDPLPGLEATSFW